MMKEEEDPNHRWGASFIGTVSPTLQHWSSPIGEDKSHPGFYVWLAPQMLRNTAEQNTGLAVRAATTDLPYKFAPSTKPKRASNLRWIVRPR
jgi:hypothetical protein